MKALSSANAEAHAGPRPALVIERLSKQFGRQPAIDGIDLRIDDGEIVSLLGPSGCGKTTTLRCVAGFYAPDGGSIEVAGRLVAGPERFVPPEERNLAMVFQNYVLWPHMNAFENVAYGLRLRRVSRADIERRVREVMAVLGLAGLEQRLPHQLSGGQQQRLSVARSLVVEPAVLLLDEPFSNLDARLRVDLRHEMRSLLKRFRTTALYVTHDQEEAMALSDRIVLMHGGRIVQEDTPVNLFQRPNSRFTAEFLGIRNFLSGAVRSADGAPVFAGEALAMPVPLHDVQFAGMGGAALLAVRDEGIEVDPAQLGRDGWFEGRIVGRTYLGGRVQLVIACNDHVTLFASVVSSDALVWPERTALRIDPRQVLVLPPESAA